jgi:xanthine dehydrogenase YagT iron-sulfur-binding subunit
MSDSKPTSGFDRRAFLAGAGAAVIPMTARGAGPAASAPAAQDPALPVDVTLRVNGRDYTLSIDARTVLLNISASPEARRAATTASVVPARCWSMAVA